LYTNYALKYNDTVISFPINEAFSSRVRRIARLYDFTNSKVLDMINETDTKRGNYYNYYTTKKWGHADSYSMCLDSSVLGIDGTAEIIEQLVRMKDNNIKSYL